MNLTCVNAGTAEAIPGEIGLRFHVVRTDRRLPIDPRIQAVLSGVRQWLPVGRNWETNGINIGFDLTAEQNVDIQQGRARLYAVGFVSYLDKAERMRITGFCRVLRLPSIQVPRTIQNCRFRRFPDPDYEYED